MNKVTFCLLLCTLLFQSNLNAQKDSPQLILRDLPMVYGVTQQNTLFKELKIQTIEYSQVDAKGVQRYSVETYDTTGLMLSKEIYDHKGNLISSFEQNFNSNNKRTSWILKHKGKETKELLEYDDQQRVTKLEHYKNGKLVNYSLYKYEGNNKQYSVLEQYNKKGLSSRNVNTFDESGRRITSERFNKKNKRKSVIDYSCSQVEGNPNPDKNTLQICQYDASEEGYLIRTVERFSSNGKLGKEVFKYRDTDTTLLELHYYVGESLRTKIAFHEVRQLFKEYVTYRKDGSEWFRDEFEYDENWNLIGEKHIEKGKVTLSKSWSYDDKGLRVKTDYQNKQKRTILSTSAKVTAYHD